MCMFIFKPVFHTGEHGRFANHSMDIPHILYSFINVHHFKYVYWCLEVVDLFKILHEFFNCVLWNMTEKLFYDYLHISHFMLKRNCYIKISSPLLFITANFLQVNKWNVIFIWFFSLILSIGNVGRKKFK